MNKNTGKIIIISILITIPISGCMRQSTQTDNGKGKKTILTTQSEDTTDFVEIISSKNIFAIPSERNTKEIEFIEAPSVILAPPQSLTITGIALDGKHYILSVENTETKERQFLVSGNEMGNYKVITILSDRIEARKTGQKEITIFKIGDQVELPGTSSQIITTADKKEVPVINKIEDPKLNSRRINKREQKEQAVSNVTVKSEASDLETELRERRKKQEEELQ